MPVTQIIPECFNKKPRKNTNLVNALPRNHSRQHSPDFMAYEAPPCSTHLRRISTKQPFIQWNQSVRCRNRNQQRWIKLSYKTPACRGTLWKQLQEVTLAIIDGLNEGLKLIIGIRQCGKRRTQATTPVFVCGIPSVIGDFSKVELGHLSRQIADHNPPQNLF